MCYLLKLSKSVLTILKLKVIQVKYKNPSEQPTDYLLYILYYSKLRSRHTKNQYGSSLFCQTLNIDYSSASIVDTLIVISSSTFKSALTVSRDVNSVIPFSTATLLIMNPSVLSALSFPGFTVFIT